MSFKAPVITGLLLAVCSLSLISFDNKHARLSKDDDGRTIFIKHCSACHMLPEPGSLTKQIWQTHVLPVMASRLGIIYAGYDPLGGLSVEEKKIVNDNYIIPDQPAMSDADWKKLSDYIISNAPDSVYIDKSRLMRNAPLTAFKRKDIVLDGQQPSLITGLKYNNATQTLWIGMLSNKALKWKYGRGVTGTINTSSPAVGFVFKNDTTYFTQIGKLYPTELSNGLISQYINGANPTLIPALHRPVSTAVDDMNGDGLPEIVVCSFGNKTGKLSLFSKKKINGRYAEKVLLELPGAIKCYIRDMNADGKKDVVAMFSQGDESVYIFYQKDKLKFSASRVLRFPPNYGTTDMVLTDYNKDGLTDIITVHGDNADYSNILKPYHGIRININNGSGNFNQKYFYPLYGVTRVLADDFDKDGDTDLVATAFFPEFTKLADESFVYLDNVNSKAFTFRSYITKSTIPLKTLTLEKADVDGDGDLDIITGHFAQSPGAVPDSLDVKWRTANYGLSIFFNQLNKPVIK
ncbi:VCBS repeat-containing protein [Mucilaginibacter sp. UR6-1]|uniref:FG-GAP repeat domain-containing protein n=1 Tax=Mucilaginibacter sp. UR6-1 TaxID=1435643 RepID=UPI001E57A41F|nr:VCBS repeat-containing protein [Mucilaginibacter sp. UR6-1]MCC8407647.1 VCBS repeat-containing protein [Mucilaginibacter sp. UR6-1]